jgi:hypothetical protein
MRLYKKQSSIHRQTAALLTTKHDKLYFLTMIKPSKPPPYSHDPFFLVPDQLKFWILRNTTFNTIQRRFPLENISNDPYQPP